MIERVSPLISCSLNDGRKETLAGGVVSVLSSLLWRLSTTVPLPLDSLTTAFSFFLAHAAVSPSLFLTNGEIPPRIEDARALLPTKLNRQSSARTWLVDQYDLGTVRYPVPATALEEEEEQEEWWTPFYAMTQRVSNAGRKKKRYVLLSQLRWSSLCT